MKYKNVGIILISSSIYYIFAELFAAIYFNDTIINTYLFHTISELGIPNNNSPLFLLMNTAFIIIGLSLIFSNISKFKYLIIKNRILFYIFTLITGVGVIIVGLIHGGNPLTSGYHTLGAIMAILGGNLLLLLISKSMQSIGKYQKSTIILSLIGLISFWIMFFNMNNIYMPVLERLSVYPLIIWSLLTGIILYKNDTILLLN